MSERSETNHEPTPGMTDRALIIEMYKRVCSMDEKVCRLEAFIEGPDDARDRGLVVRVDRLEQAEQRRTWWTTTAVGAGIVAFLTALASFFSGGRAP